MKSQGTGIIILSHGSRLSKANRLTSEITAALSRKMPDAIIEPSSLQFQQPDFSATIRKLVRLGCKKIIVVPLFLFEGNHVQRDIPRAIKKELVKYPGVSLTYAKSLGADQRIADIVFDRIKEAMKCA